jgi:hypothetical protein
MPLTFDEEWLWSSLLWLAVALTLLSGAQYAWQALAPKRGATGAV